MIFIALSASVPFFFLFQRCDDGARHVIGHFRRSPADQFEQRIWQFTHKVCQSVKLGRASVNRWSETPDEPVLRITPRLARTLAPPFVLALHFVMPLV